MSPQIISSDQKQPAASRPLWRPEETFWQHYSPHHEFPVATVSAFTLCGLAIGMLVLLWLLGLGLSNEADGPPPVYAATIGPLGGGPGSDGLGTGATPLAANAMTELGASTDRKKLTLPQPVEATVQLPDDVKVNPLAVAPTTQPETPSDPALFKSLQEDLKQAQREFKIAAERAAVQKGGKGQKSGVGGLPGNGDGPGAGGVPGTGIGTKTGPGTGGRAPTRQEILAWRWRFDLSGEGPEHANKLVAVGVTLAVMAPDNKFYLIRDLKKRPVDLTPADLTRHQDEVKWYNTRPDSLRNLAMALGLRFQPRYVVMLLPKEREQKMAQLEHDEMERRGLQTIRTTEFDFRLNNGAYEPVVTKIE